MHARLEHSGIPSRPGLPSSSTTSLASYFRRVPSFSPPRSLLRSRYPHSSTRRSFFPAFRERLRRTSVNFGSHEVALSLSRSAGQTRPARVFTSTTAIAMVTSSYVRRGYTRRYAGPRENDNRNFRTAMIPATDRPLYLRYQQRHASRAPFNRLRILPVDE